MTVFLSLPDGFLRISFINVGQFTYEWTEEMSEPIEKIFLKEFIFTKWLKVFQDSARFRENIPKLRFFMKSQ